MSHRFYKCPCSSCDGHIEFPEEGVGLSVACPHCGKMTCLVAAKTNNEPPGSFAPAEDESDSKPSTGESTELEALPAHSLPPLELLSEAAAPAYSVSREDLLAKARQIQQVLALYGVESALGDISKGPTFTRFELHAAPGVRLERFADLAPEVAAALSVEHVQVITPVPGKGSVGIDVPNADRREVTLRELLRSEEWSSTPAEIPFPLGIGVAGEVIIEDVAQLA